MARTYLIDYVPWQLLRPSKPLKSWQASGKEGEAYRRISKAKDKRGALYGAYRGEIRVPRSLKGQKEMEVLVHEFLHACFWGTDEYVIGEAGKVIAQVLWDEGFRKSAEARRASDSPGS